MIYWNPGMKLEDSEKLIANEALNFYNSEEKAAQSLDISIKDFKKIIKKYQEDVEKSRKIQEKRLQDEEDFILRSRGIHKSISV